LLMEELHQKSKTAIPNYLSKVMRYDAFFHPKG
jgi:hypothetical protein